MAPRASTSDLFTAAPLPVATLDSAQRVACLRLIRSENIGPVSFRALINRFGGAEQALAALPDLARRGGSRRPIRLFPREAAERELSAAERAGAVPVFTIEPGYPAPLAVIEAPPPLVYVRGDASLFSRPMVAIVGSRESSAAGQAFARQLATALGREHLVIVSGLARGIDAAAHRAALASGTVAVLAGGIDTVYPPEHADLQAAIAEHGCLVTEQPPGLVPRAQDFPRRNRIIAGMSHAVIVVEAAARSGSLITARMAAEMGRPVLAVPGHPLDPRAEGTNRLLRDGAELVTSAADVLASLAPMIGPPRRAPLAELEEAARPIAGHGPQDINPRAVPAADAVPDAALDATPDRSAAADAPERLVRVLGAAPISVDEAARAAGLSAGAAQAAVLELSIAGRVAFHGAQLISLLPQRAG